MSNRKSELCFTVETEVDIGQIIDNDYSARSDLLGYLCDDLSNDDLRQAIGFEKIYDVLINSDVTDLGYSTDGKIELEVINKLIEVAGDKIDMFALISSILSRDNNSDEYYFESMSDKLSQCKSEKVLTEFIKKNLNVISDSLSADDIFYILGKKLKQ